jgi:hypothetical protein
VKGTKNLIKLATEYYKSLFGPGEGNLFEVDANLWRTEDRVSNVENANLTKPFLEEEIKGALFQMKKNKAIDLSAEGLDHTDTVVPSRHFDVSEADSSLESGMAKPIQKQPD